MPRKTQSIPTVNTVIPTITPESRVRVIIEMPQSLFEIYESQGMKSERMPEDEILQRLHRCKNYTASKPLYLNDELRAKLEHAVGHNFSSAETAIMQVINAVSLQVGDAGVQLPPRLTQRLASRAKAERRTFEEIVNRETLKGLSVYAGLLPG